jgi:hypothetical protein
VGGAIKQKAPLAWRTFIIYPSLPLINQGREVSTKEGLLRLRLSFPCGGRHQTKNATGVAYFYYLSFPPSDKSGSGSVNQRGIASPAAQLSLWGGAIKQKAPLAWRTFIIYPSLPLINQGREV